MFTSLLFLVLKRKYIMRQLEQRQNIYVLVCAHIHKTEGEESFASNFSFQLCWNNGYKAAKKGIVPLETKHKVTLLNRNIQ